MPSAANLSVALCAPARSIPTPRSRAGGLAYEPKYDGFRALLTVTERGVQLTSRRGKDLSVAFPEIIAAASNLEAGWTVDGELLILDTAGRSDFRSLLSRMGRNRTAASASRALPAVLAVFDVLAAPGRDLRMSTYTHRRAILTDLIAHHPELGMLVPMTTSFEEASEWMTAGETLGIEGIVAKALDDVYPAGKRRWIKVRREQTYDAIVAGVHGNAQKPSALVLAAFDDHGELRPIGLTRPLSPRQAETLAGLLTTRCPGHPWHATVTARTSLGGVWRDDAADFVKVAPSLVVEVIADSPFENGHFRHTVRFVRPHLDADPAAVHLPTLPEAVRAIH